MKKLGPNPVGLVLAAGIALALLQQQLLLRRPPRLLELKSTTASSGPAALDLRFSRPMQQIPAEAGTPAQWPKAQSEPQNPP